MILFFFSTLLLPPLYADPPEFSGVSAFKRLEVLVTAGARHYEAPTRMKQIINMEKTLADYGWGIQRQSFNVLETRSQKEYRLHNIIALDPRPPQATPHYWNPLGHKALGGRRSESQAAQSAHFRRQ